MKARVSLAPAKCHNILISPSQHRGPAVCQGILPPPEGFSDI